MSEELEPSPDEMLAIAAEIADSYPPPRAGTELVILDVHPHRAHAYWHVDAEEWKGARSQAGVQDSLLVIRLHDVTGIEFNGRNPHDTFDTPVSGEQGQADLNIRRDGRTYLGELGFRRPDGHLVRLAVSEPFELPQAPPIILPSLPPEAEPVKLDVAVAPVVPPVVGPWPSAADLASVLPARDEAVEAFYEKAEALPSPITIAQQTMEIEVRDVPAGPVLPAMPAEIPCEQHPVARPALAPIRLEDHLSYSSHGLGQPSEEVEVKVDIAIHGRIPPGRTATLFGRCVHVDAQGRFEFRQELPHPSAVLGHVWRHDPPSGS